MAEDAQDLDDRGGDRRQGQRPFNGVDRRKGDRRVSMETRNYAEGRYIFREFESGDLAFIVKSGTVEIVKNIDEKDVVLATIGEGQLFGELALIDNCQRMASARAAGGTVELFVISSQQFAKQLSEAQPFVRGLLKMLSEQVRATTERAGRG